jgi:membrane fusion protein, multidrug efflux system
MMRSAILLGVSTIVLAGCGAGPKAAEVSAPPVQARVVTVDSARVPDLVELYGTVEAERTAVVASRVMATVTAVDVKPGDRVTAGQVLVEIDPATARGQEAEARGALAQAHAGFALAERNYERFKALAAKNAASELELDLARMQYEQAKGAVTQGEGALEAASSVARGSRVVAPFDGWVAAKLVEVGDLAAPGRPLVSVESAIGRRLVLAVPESVLSGSGLELGSRIPVRLDALASAPALEGTVAEISPGADPTSHTFRVKLDLHGAVRAGVSGRASLTTGTRTAVTVPREAVLSSGGLDLVVVRDGQGRSRSRAVTLGAQLDGDRVEVLSGVAVGDEVAVGLTSVPADGTPVESRP